MNNLSIFKTIRIWGILLILLMVSCNEEESELYNQQEKLIYICHDIALNQFTSYIFEAMHDISFRQFLKNEIVRKIDGDYSMIYELVKTKRIGNETLEEYFIKRTGDSNFFTALSENLPLVQLSIPINFEKWDEINDELHILTVGEDFIEGEFDYIYSFSKEFEKNSEVFSLIKKPSFPVVIVGYNERSFINSEGNIQLLTYPSLEKRQWNYHDELSSGRTIKSSNPDSQGGFSGSLSGSCSQTCSNNLFQTLQLCRVRMDNISAVETWIFGAPELRFNILGGSSENKSKNILESFFEPNKRKDIDRRWLYLNDHLFQWKEDDGDRIWFYWIEEDGGIFSEEQHEFELKVNSFEFKVTLPVFLRKNHKKIGEFSVERNECGQKIRYGNYTLYFELSSR